MIPVQCHHLRVWSSKFRDFILLQTIDNFIKDKAHKDLVLKCVSKEVIKVGLPYEWLSEGYIKSGIKHTILAIYNSYHKEKKTNANECYIA